jgi:addiction module RelB/DinJ family antitoxin
MNNTKTLTVRLNPTLKDQFTATCAEMGLSVSTVFSILAKAVVKEKKFPFEAEKYEDTNLIPISEYYRRSEEIDKGNFIHFTAEEWDKWVADNA